MKTKFSIILFFILIMMNVESQILIPYSMNGQIGFINERLQKITEPIYTQLLEINSTGYAKVRKTDNSVILINPRGETIASSVYSGILNDFYLYKQNQIDNKIVSTTIISLQTGYNFTKPVGIGVGSTTSMTVTIIDGTKPSWSYMDYTGELLFPNRRFMRAYQFDETGNAAVVLDENFDPRIINRFGEYTCEAQWNYLYNKVTDGLCFGITKSNSGYYTIDGKLNIPIKLLQPVTNETIYFYPEFNSGVLPVIVNNDTFSVVPTGTSIKNSSWCIINKNGRCVSGIIIADCIESFSEGFARVQKDDKWYYVNTDGTFLTQHGFNSASDFINGYARIQIDNRDGILDRNGTIYWCNELQ